MTNVAKVSEIVPQKDSSAAKNQTVFQQETKNTDESVFEIADKNKAGTISAKDYSENKSAGEKDNTVVWKKVTGSALGAGGGILTFGIAGSMLGEIKQYLKYSKISPALGDYIKGHIKYCARNLPIAALILGAGIYLMKTSSKPQVVNNKAQTAS